MKGLLVISASKPESEPESELEFELEFEPESEPESDLVVGFIEEGTLSEVYKKVSICLWFKAAGEGGRELGEQFEVGKSTDAHCGRGGENNY